MRDHPLLSILFLGQDSSNGARVHAEIGVQDEGLSIELGISQDGRGEQDWPQLPKGFHCGFSFRQSRDVFMSLPLSVVDQWSGEGRVSSDEPSVVSALPQEGS